MDFDVKFDKHEDDIKTYTDEIEFDTTTSWDWEPQGFAKDIEFEYGTLGYHWTLTDKRSGESFSFVVTLEVDAQDWCEEISSEDSYVDLDGLHEDDIKDLLYEEIDGHSLTDFVDSNSVSKKALAGLKNIDSNWEMKDELINSLLDSID